MKIPFLESRRTVLKRIVQYSTLGIFALSASFAGSFIQRTQAQNRPGINTTSVNLAYQTSGDIVKIKGAVEPQLKKLGITVNWIPFPAGPQLLEAMNAGRVDIGSVGETPPIFAQAAGAQLVYISGRKPSEGRGQALIVQKDSPIKKLSDLKGKKVVFQKGSSAHYLVLRALKEAGLKISDIQSVSLTPAEARDAFLQKKIDAWAVWDPNLAFVQREAGARVLRDSSGISTQGGFYLARREFATKNPEVVRVFLEEVDKLGEWAEQNPTEVAKILAPELKLDVPLLEQVTRRRTYRLKKLTPSVLTQQQRVADEYFEAKLLPRKIDIKEFLLESQQYQALTPKRLE
ncbi:sulfonate ABC transporter substrate-binding protein [Aetokthonos hydrillicola Thurmond2011]|jgi:sulfonate transport system substrate-binding protein|uniref:Putative aliphatic sulfonates-binding protein n=1 Tax=Aetokthonos hydrillicola Thurmond2011 TaxID=2712845 RepID=A0AAP5I5U2_9CYAN|nr:sulfonate ABC transporter substrate-binding protein [Aetokthonos hydrillicola]MBO3460183.1 sulfonate ABC transporter substrate-binding protein [Aetokthonos hydrillicola CCALA 1050]MBW4590551.1 sulfonate ABC transporter substrate-binding protein [Aetokthonos hydrillicola CCALA 1050]MDR9893040.1 sulfonate ABC transporter substrate-binding protein [Aetokthonos hydrillicola Thurmond2011]